MKCYTILEKRRTWVLLMLSLLVPPVVILGFPRQPYMEEVDLVSRRTAANGGNRVEGKPQKDITSEIVALQNALKLDELAPAVDWLMQRVYGNDPSLATAPSARVLTACLADRLTSSILAYGKVAASGTVSYPAQQTFGFMDLFSGTQEQPAINYLAPLQLGMFANALAADAFAQLETTRALSLIETGRHLGTLPFLHEISHMRTMSILTNVLQSLRVGNEVPAVCATINGMPEPPAVQAANSFTPRFSPAANFFAGSFETRHALTNIVQNIANEEPWMQREENRAWAKSMKEQAGNPQDSRARLGLEQFPFPVWTITHLQRKALKHIVETEPNLTWKRMGAPEIFADVDPVSAAYYGASVASQGVSRRRVRLTAQALLHLACAAHEYKAQHGRWPTEPGDLNPTGMPGLPPIDNSSGQKRHFGLLKKNDMAYGPIAVGEQEVTTETLPLLLGATYANSLITWTVRQTSSENSRKTFEVEALAQADRAAFPTWLLVEAMGQKPGVEVTTFSLAAVRYIDREVPITSAAEAFQVSTATNWPFQFAECHEQALVALTGSTQAAAEIKARPTPSAVSHVILRATVEVPAKVFAVHSYGPDGKPGDFGNTVSRLESLAGTPPTDHDQLLFLLSED